MKKFFLNEKMIVVVEVQEVYDDDEENPEFSIGTLNFLKEVERRFELNDVDWLQRNGKVYVALQPQ